MISKKFKLGTGLLFNGKRKVPDIYSPPFGGADNFDAEWPGRTLSLEARYRIRK